MMGNSIVRTGTPFIFLEESVPILNLGKDMLVDSTNVLPALESLKCWRKKDLTGVTQWLT